MRRRAAAIRFCGALVLVGAVACEQRAFDDMAGADTPVAGKGVVINTGWKLQFASAVPEAGEILSSAAYEPAGWYKATVPGTVLTSLVNEGVYPEPLYGRNNLSIPESLNQNRYWYRLSFEVPPSFRGRTVWLNFDGINFEAEIWLNGENLGHLKGAFKQSKFDVTSRVTFDGQNALAVLILPPPHPGVPHEQTLSDAGPNGGSLGADSPTFVASIGWDWMPGIRDRNIGIYQDVFLSASGPVVIEDPYVTSDLPLPDTSRADLAISADVVNNTAIAQHGVLRGRIEGLVFEQAVTLSPGEVRTVRFDRLTHPVLSISNPRLWWPNGYGQQEMYELELSFDIGSLVSSERKVRFGIRELSYESTQGGWSENAFPPKNVRHVRVVGTRRGTRWGFSLYELEVYGRATGATNLALGRKASASSVSDDLVAKNGTDGDPATRWASQFKEPEWLAVDLGAVTQVDRVRLDWERAYAKAYKIQVSADGKTWEDVATGNAPEMKILVNGQKILCKGGNWGMAEALLRTPKAKLAAQMRLHKEANLTMIRNWVGQTDDEGFYDQADENGILIYDEFWLANPVDGANPEDPQLFLDHARAKIKRYRNHPSIALWCARNEGYAPEVIDEGLARAVAELDGARRYQPSSIHEGVHGQGPYKHVPVERYYDTWAFGFTTEIGLPSIPSAESIREMMPQKDWWPISEAWGYHDYAGYNCKPYLGIMTTRYGAPTSMEDFVRKGQLINYENYRGIFEAWNHRLWQDTSGVLLWMSHPAQPSFVWQLYDYYLEPTASYFGAKKACETLHVQMNLDDSMVTVINNRLETIRGLMVTASVYDLDGTLRSSRTAPVEAQANQFTNCFAVDLPAEVSRVYFVKLELRDAAGALLSDNFYWRARDLTDYTKLDALPAVALLGSATLHTDGDSLTLATTVHNPTKAVALSVRLKLLRDGSQGRVLPVTYGDNYFSLLPGESRQVTIDFDRRELMGEAPRLEIEGWNVVPAKIQID